MKLNEFVDRLYAMGDMESTKTIRPKRPLNEGYYDVSDELFDEYKSDDYKDVGDIYNEIMFNYNDKYLADDVVSKIELYRRDRDDYYDEDDLDESLVEDINGAMPMADNRHGLLKFNDKNWIKLGDGKEIKLLSSSKMIYDENKNKVLNSINCIVIFDDDTDYGEVYCQSISSDDFIDLVSQVKAMDKSQLLNFIEQNGGRIIYSRNRNGSGLDESYDYELFDDVCKEYSSLYPYDISLGEVWDEIVSKYGDEDLADDVVEYLEDAF